MELDREPKSWVMIAAKGDANVLITGPTGSGKTCLAREIHDQSSRKNRPFVAVNLATLHEGTFESELFGHEKGAFTSADRRRVGRLESAQHGTVFLDEVGELSLQLQARLLEFLHSRIISPVGAGRDVYLDVRVIAATNKNLEEMVTRGTFREDLFHRLRVIPIELKPICERWDEIDLIIHSSLAELSGSTGRSILRVSEEVAKRLEEYHWPGNFRELKNVLEYAVLAGCGPEVRIQDLPPWFGKAQSVKVSFNDTTSNHDSRCGLLGNVEIPLILDYQACFASFEKEYLRRALNRYRGKINQTAKKIGMSKTTLLRRIRTHQLALQD